MEKALAPQRKEWLDALRGLAIFLVVLLHNLPAGDEKMLYIILTGPIKLPLFFAISGYVFNPRDGKQGAFFLNLLRKIFIPSLVFFTCLHAPSVLTRGFPFLLEKLQNFLTGEACWYIAACILGEILFFYNLKFCKKQWQICMTALICCGLGFVMALLGIGDFMMLNRAFIAQFFLLLGYLFRQHEPFFKKLHWSVLVGAGLVIAGMMTAGYFLMPDRGIDVHMNNYYGTLETVPFSFILITLFTLGLMTIGTKCGRISKILAFAGRHTLITYIWHGFFVALGLRVLPLGDSTGLLLMGKCILLAVFAIGMCTLGGVIINWLLPELMGRKRIKKEKS